MRYIKVLLGVIVFFLVMLFFVQNQTAFSQTTNLKLDLVLYTFETTGPVHFYTLLLITFLLGALVCFLMLVWDRLSLSGRVGISKMKIRSLERDLDRTEKNRDVLIKQIEDLEKKLGIAEAKLAEELDEEQETAAENDEAKKA